MSASSELAFLESLLEEATAALAAVDTRRMFGCQVFRAAGNSFALVWKDGRIGLKFPDPALVSELRAMKGAEPWSPGGKMVMEKWVLVPESFHDDTEALATWAKRAHALALAGAGEKKGKPAKKATAKKGSAKKPAVKKPAVKKPAAQRAGEKKVTAKKATAKKVTAKKTTPRG